MAGKNARQTAPRGLGIGDVMNDLDNKVKMVNAQLALVLGLREELEAAETRLVGMLASAAPTGPETAPTAPPKSSKRALGRNGTKGRVLLFVDNQPRRAFSVADIAAGLEIDQSSVRRALASLANEKAVLRPRRGIYGSKKIPK